MKANKSQHNLFNNRLPLARQQFWTHVTNPRYWLFPLLVFGLGVASSTEIAFTHADARQHLGPRYPLVAFQWMLSFIGGFTAIFVGYASITGDRNSGRLPLVLKLPYTRGEYVFQKFLGHAGALSTLLVLAFGCGFAITSVVLGPPPVFGTLAFIGVSVLYVLVWLSISMTVSMLVGTGRRAIAILIPIFIGTGAVWRTTFTSVLGPVLGELPQPLYFLVYRLVPFRAYLVATNWIAGLPNSHSFGTSAGEELNPRRPPDATIIPLELNGSVPWYLTEWLTIPFLLFWLVVPPVVAYRRFDAVDLV